jgi:hypothetical protein
MSDPLSASPRPTVFPTPSRDPPNPPSSRSAAHFAARSNGATPLPASLQAKMAAVRLPGVTIRTCISLQDRRWQTGFPILQMSTLLLRHSSASASVLLLVHPLFPAWLPAVTSPYSNSVTSPVGKILVAALQALVMEQAQHRIQNGLLAAPWLQPVPRLLTLARLCKLHGPHPSVILTHLTPVIHPVH